MKNKHYILVALILLIGGFILFFLRQVLFDNGLIRGMAFSAAIVAGILILIIAVIRLVISVIRKSRGKMTNNDSENQPVLKGLPTATVFVFFTLLPVLAGLLSWLPVTFSHYYIIHHVHTVNLVWLAVRAIFLITALMLVIYTTKLAVTKRVSWVWIIVTVIVTGTAIVVGGLLLLFAGFVGMLGA
jgi:hypothetical protein